MRMILILVISLVSRIAMGQAVLGGVQSKGMDMNPQPGGFITQIKADTKEVKGNVYLYEQWLMGDIQYVNNAKILSKFIRYNIQLNSVEIRLEDEKMGSSEGRHIASFEIVNGLTQEKEKFINASKFDFENTKLIGFMKEVYPGTFSLYSKTEVKLVQGNYVAALDMGEEDDTFSKKTVYYISNNNQLIGVTSNKKRFAEKFPEMENEILNYIKEQNLSLKTEKDLMILVIFLNRIKV